MKTLGTLALSLTLALSAATSSRADVWLLDIVSVQPGVTSHLGDSYLGALDLVARRHGGVRVSRFHESAVADLPTIRLVGLWRFPNAGALEALLADPNYASITRLRARTIDGDKSSTLQLVADRSPATR
jgi:hypothetical protein